MKYLKDLFEKANGVQDEERKKTSKSTSGTLRGAMAGALTPQGLLAAKCGRLDQARILGVERTVSQGERVMFSAGFGHELYLLKQFEKIKQLDKTFDFQADTPIQSEVNGVKWMGTPDFMLSFDNGKKILGVEAKSLVSNFSVHKQASADWPFRRHILQSAHYMTVLNHSEWLIIIGHYFYAMADGKQYPPSIRFYRVFLEDDASNFKVENEKGEILELDFNKKQILDYLNLLVKANKDGVLTPKPKWVEFSKNIRGYNECSYCPMQSSCNEYDNNKLTKEQWLDRLKKVEK